MFIEICKRNNNKKTKKNCYQTSSNLLSIYLFNQFINKLIELYIIYCMDIGYSYEIGLYGWAFSTKMDKDPQDKESKAEWGPHLDAARDFVC